MSQIQYPLFYRQFGVRRVSELLSPKFVELQGFPRDSLLHFLSNDPEALDIDTDAPWLQNYSKKISVFYPEQMTESNGNPVRTAKMMNILVKPWHLANTRKFKRIISEDLIEKDPLSLTIYNYNYLKKLFRYPPSPMQGYHRWINIQATAWENIGKTIRNTGKNQFLFLNIPKELPSRTFLNMFSTKESIQMLKIFNTPEKLFFLELWKWIDPETRNRSVISRIPESELPRLTVVFDVRADRQIVLNLGYLASWIKGNENFTDFQAAQQYHPATVRMLLLKTFMVLEQASREDEIPESDSLNQVDASNTDKVDADRSEVDLDDDEDDQKNTVDSFQPSQITKDSTGKDAIVSKSLDDLGDGLFDSYDVEKEISKMEDELKLMDRISERKMAKQGIVAKANEIVEIPDEEAKVEVTVEEIEKAVLVPKTPEEALKEKIETRLDLGAFTGAEYKKLLAESEKINELPDPFGGKKKLVEAAKIVPEDLIIDKEKTVIETGDSVEDKSMLESTLMVYDKKYLETLMKKDILNSVKSFQKAGVVIRKVEAETHTDVLGSYTTISVEMKPVDGKPSMVHMRVPVVDEDGTFVAGGNKYLLRKQIVDVPFRVIGPDEVALSSAYGKNFIVRNRKKAKNTVEWIDRKVTLAGLEGQGKIKKTAPANVFLNSFTAPYIYNAMATKYSFIQTDELFLSFDYREREKYAKPQQIDILEKDGSRIAGYTKSKQFITVDNQNNFWRHEGSKKILIGDIYECLGLDQTQAPVDFVDMKIFRAQLPIAVFLSYHIGFDNLLKLLRAPYRYVEPRKQKDLKPYEYAITFKDGSLVFDRRDQRNSLILGGLTEFEKELKKIEREDLNSRDIYLNLLESKSMNSSHLREMDNLNDMFLDPITIDVLGDMNLPQTFNGLLIKAAEELTRYNAPDETDVTQMRMRGYERIAQFMYSEMANSVRQFRGANFGGRSKVNMSPWAVWSKIMEDQTVKIAEDINPLQNVKETDAMTFAGNGGRSKDSMPKATREYHPSSAGFVSEATVDSSDVGINVFLSNNPSLKDMRGLVQKPKDLNAGNIFSLSTLCAPGCTADDAKRVGMVSVMASHTVFTEGSHAPQVRTGGEEIVAHRTSDMFCYSAKDDGVVKEVNDNGIVVQYKDGSTRGIPIGRRYGKAEGTVYPHHLVTPFKAGQKFKKGQPLTYNDRFFDIDPLTGGAVMKTSMTMRIALIDGKDSYEDSSAIAAHISSGMATQTTKIRSFTVDFSQSVHEVVRTGSKVSPKDLLMLIQDEISSGVGSFGEGSMATLRGLSSQKAKSKYLGVVERIEVYYHGDKADMSETIRALADRSDRMLSAESRALGKQAVNGSVTDDYRVEGTPLGLNKAEIKFFVTVSTGAGVGDKLVFANQMKCTIGRVIETPIHTESGLLIDGIFGFRGFGNRIVTSPVKIGTTITVLNLIADKAVQLYEGK